MYYKSRAPSRLVMYEDAFRGTTSRAAKVCRPPALQAMDKLLSTGHEVDKLIAVRIERYRENGNYLRG